MNFRTRRVLMSLLIIVAVNVVAFLFVKSVPSGALGVLTIIGFELALVFSSFKLAEVLCPPPPVAEMTFQEALNTIWKSPIFIGALVTFIFTIVNIVLGTDLTSEDADYIINLDWSNIPGAILAAALMVMRKFNKLNETKALKEN